MHVNSNSKALRNFGGRDISDNEFLLSILIFFIVATEVDYLKCNNVNDANSLQILCHCCNIILVTEVASYKFCLLIN